MRAAPLLKEFRHHTDQAASRLVSRVSHSLHETEIRSAIHHRLSGFSDRLTDRPAFIQVLWIDLRGRRAENPDILHSCTLD